MKKKKILSLFLVFSFCLSVLFTPLSSGGFGDPPFPGDKDEPDVIEQHI